jgi:type II restriction enzyme
MEEYYRLIKENKNWKSESRIVGEACEEYIKNNLKCARCDSNNFIKCKTNEKSKDLICQNCCQNYQIKAYNKSERSCDNIKKKKYLQVLGAEYTTTLNNLHMNIDFIVILYERKKNYKIHSVIHIKSENITNSCIKPRKPLSSKAKRAGWTGCVYLFNDFNYIK